MKKIMLFVTIVLFSTYLFAEKITLTFSIDDFSFEKQGAYDIVNPPLNNDYIFTNIPGHPQLPLKIITLSLPQNQQIGDVKIMNAESQKVNGKFTIYPVQKPKVLSDDSPVEFVQTDPLIYGKSSSYPAEIVRQTKSGFLSGFHLGSLLVSPFQYNPITKELVFIQEIEIEYELTEMKNKGIEINKRSDASQQYLNNEISKLVFNPKDVCEPEIVHKGLRDEVYEYVIITNDDFVDQFQPLADWKTQKGMRTLLVNTTYIFSNYDGVDTAEKVRNFIKDYYQNHGTIWVLLGGDTNYVPYRVAFAFDCEYSSYSDNFLPCDLYFSDLDGTWNDNGNDIWGELEDNVDMYPDVFVGRASVETTIEATAFVDKILTYEKNPPVGYQTDMMFLAQVLWNDPYTDSGVSKNFIDNAYVPDQFDSITKLYQSLGNTSHDIVVDSLNAGQHIVNHCGHAWYGSMSLGNGSLSNSTMDNLINSPAFSIWYTIGCWPAAFDYNCIAEHWINNPNGGGVAFIGNSRYGWGSPGNPLYGYSDTFDQEFFKQLFQEGIQNIGMTMGLAKSVYVPFSRNENVFRWCEYEINLLGEPEMNIWTDVPEILTVTYPDSVTIGTCDVQVSVYDGVQPMHNALVCFMQGDDVYQTGYTNLQGSVNLTITTGTILDDLLLTVTAQNFLPYQDTIKIISDQPYVLIDSYTTNNSIDGYVVPGATISVDAGFHNFGQMPADNLECILQSNSDLITFIDNTHSIAHIDPKTALFQENIFSFTVSSDIENEEVVELSYTISDNSKALWVGTLPITGAMPIFEYIYHQVDDSVNGNGNNIPEPSEQIDIELIVKNTGLSQSFDTQLSLSSNSPCVNIPYCIWDVGDVPAGQCTESTVTLMINSSCIPPEFADIELAFIDSLGFTCVDSFTLTIGETGFSDDVESGDDKWTHWGIEDLWHLTERKSVSGTYSWYCGIEDSVYYPDDVDETLESIPFTIGTSPALSFWSWNEFTNYGVDGFYVEIFNGTDWIILDFIGSGGALPVLTTKNGWLEYIYDLSNIPPGTESKIRFKFISDDEDVAEGVYVDDVIVYTDDCPIHVDFIADKFYGKEPVTVNFYDHTYTETGPITSWNWDFGDGEFSNEMNPQHVFNEDGLFAITLQVSDQFGIYSSTMKADFIHVRPDTTKTVYVNQDGTGDFTNLSEAFDALNAGDSIIVADGIYGGVLNTDLVIPNNNITICSENGYENCIIDGGDAQTAFMCGFKEGITIAGLTFSSCSHSSYGGALSTNGSVTILDCYFDECSSDLDGGAMWSVGGTSLQIENCIFENCNADNGGAVYIELLEQVALHNNEFSSCQSNDDSGGALYMNVINTLDINSCDFNQCSALTPGEGGAILTKDVYAMQIKKSHFSECESVISGGALQTEDCQDVLIDSCSFMYNESASGGAIKFEDSSVDITHCEFGFNDATIGAGCYIVGGCLVMIDNSLFYENSSTNIQSKGGALYVNDCIVAVINSTIANNSVNTQAGGISHLGTRGMSIYNTILWDNHPLNIWAVDSTKINIAFSDMTTPWTGTGNISQDPLFQNISSQNYHLNELSPCIDTGNNSFVQAETDLDAHMRIWDGSGIGEAIVDMGCYEYGSPIYDIDPQIPDQTTAFLLKSFPNPFKAQTQISFYVPQLEQCSIEIYNIKGQKVATVLDEEKAAGLHTTSWDGKNYQNREVANGIYFYVLNAGNKREVKKLILMR
ncbi:MAG: T9SS type A sorting domain-containing protein [Candidatus Cloacimonetes bacterium]|nr:T9SS type A sorting domain-containing protein [Candidatus Cloacimonadota bacterium]